MTEPIAPEPVMRAALQLFYVAAIKTRSWTYPNGTVSQDQINDLWDALHEIPNLLRRWKDHEDCLRELRSYFRGYDAKWDDPSSGRPVLLRVEGRAGHGQGKPLSKSLEEWTDVWTFLFAELGLHP